MGRYLFGRSLIIFLTLQSIIVGQETFLTGTVQEKVVPYLFTSEKKSEDFPIEKYLTQIDPYIEKYTTRWAIHYLSDLWEQSNPYRLNISSKIWQENLPADLINLPIIESAWDPFSLSNSGALGIWQFMNNSIPRSFVNNRWRDDRKDFLLSTDAAISKFHFNLEKTKGDWLLALAGYNCGINHITRSLAQVEDKTYWELRAKGYLPEQTEHYIPRFLAVNHILNRKVHYGLSLYWEKSIYWIQLPLRQVQFLPETAERLEMDFNLLRLANAELNEWITPVDDSAYLFKIPLQKLRLFEQKYSWETQGFIPHILDAENYGKIETDNPVLILHKVVKGENIWNIANLYGCSVEEILRINGLSEGFLLEPGMLLFTPSFSSH